MILFQNLHLPIDTKPIYPLTSLSNNKLTKHYSIILTYHTTDLKAKSKPGQQPLHIHFHPISNSF